MGDANWCYAKWVKHRGNPQRLEEFGFHIYNEIGKTTVKDNDLISAIDHIYSTLSDTIAVKAFKIEKQDILLLSQFHLPICAKLKRKQP
jgi:hypothetical protein